MLKSLYGEYFKGKEKNENEIYLIEMYEVLKRINSKLIKSLSGKYLKEKEKEKKENEIYFIKINGYPYIFDGEIIELLKTVNGKILKKVLYDFVSPPCNYEFKEIDGKYENAIEEYYWNL